MAACSAEKIDRPEKAAAELVEMMLKDVQNRDDRTFVLDKYQVDEQTLYDRDDMLDQKGYVHGQGDGSESIYRYILIRSGSLWRLQSCKALQQLDEQLR